MSKTGVGRIIFTQAEIQQRIGEVAAEINRDYEGQRLIIISVLKGSIFFVADLTRHLTVPLKIDFLSTRVPSETTKKNGGIQFVKDLDYNLQDQHVLLVEDVIGTGLTLGLVRRHLEAAQPASLKICTLLDNPAGRLLPINIDYCCFTMPDLYLVGYGLDHEEEYRNLPYIAEYKRG